MRKGGYLAIVAALALAGCANREIDNAKEAERLMQTSRDWSKAAAANDMDEVLKYFTDDAVMLQEGQPPVRGREALRAYLAEASKVPDFGISWEPIEAKVSGDMGYLLERTQMNFVGPQGQRVTQNFQAVTIWRKQPDGSWKNVVDASIPAAPAAAPAAG